ncbi:MULTISPECIES: prolyl oligopeptidase family serine peptidase [Bradyrhizobium]|uniref:prolyl oligopeptidase family serine peptidase n=1 Tax=Bradyrhizobium TaxID=374 RepID=UPI0023EA4DDA|nr:prolyl oligopeptidase family serine peptidase [Bradyrhizobium yuanmingense]
MCFDTPSWARAPPGSASTVTPPLPSSVRGSKATRHTRSWWRARPYPAPLILTSTKDDRTHPAHGRKAAAKLAALGQPYFYYENIDGGHSAAANLMEDARQLALEYTYASRRLCSE